MHRITGRIGWALAVTLALFVVAALAGVVRGGPLDPPLAPAPTQPQVEPRTPIGSLPFTIGAAGSYFLTANLTGASGANGITVNADNVTIDLNGFVLSGGPSPGHGIFVGAPRENLAVKNGTVRGWNVAIEAANASNGLFEGLRVSDNQTGLSSGSNSVVRNISAKDNVSTGILAGENSVLSAVTARSNGTGIFVLAHGNVSDCASSDNTVNGIFLFGGRTRLEGCTVEGNASDGIVVLIGGDACLITANNASYNAGAGVHVINGARSRIDDNNVAGNGQGIRVDSVGNVVVRNTATGNSTNYQVVAGNDLGPVGTAAASTSPWANISNP